MNRPRSFAPIIAAVLLLLPVLYVGSYLAVVVPSPFPVKSKYFPPEYSYRCGGEWAYRIFWPLEQIDRRVRPGAWDALVVPPLSPRDGPRVGQ
jgi:hypothetical protein